MFFTPIKSHIAEVCLCVPEYIPDVYEILENRKIKACNFYEHATCVSYVRYYFDPAVADCITGCLVMASNYFFFIFELNK